MPHRGQRIYATQTLRVSQVINAPLPYVFAWCTDYRSDDGKLSVSKVRPRFRVVRLSPRRLLRIRVTPHGSNEPEVAVDLIRLDPPDGWRTDQIDENDLEAVEYQLTRIGREKTRLDLLVTERWIVPRFPTADELRRRVRGSWDRYARWIEGRYRSGLPPTG